METFSPRYSCVFFKVLEFVLLFLLCQIQFKGVYLWFYLIQVCICICHFSDDWVHFHQHWWRKRIEKKMKDKDRKRTRSRGEIFASCLWTVEGGLRSLRGGEGACVWHKRAWSGIAESPEAEQGRKGVQTRITVPHQLSVWCVRVSTPNCPGHRPHTSGCLAPILSQDKEQFRAQVLPGC